MGFIRWKSGMFFVFGVAAILLVWGAEHGLTGDVRAVDVVPDEEKRSSFHEVDGYAYLSENITVGDLRTMAFANAKRQALEMAETYIRSKTKVSEGKLDYDLV